MSRRVSTRAGASASAAARISASGVGAVREAARTKTRERAMREGSYQERAPLARRRDGGVGRRLGLGLHRLPELLVVPQRGLRQLHLARGLVCATQLQAQAAVRVAFQRLLEMRDCVHRSADESIGASQRALGVWSAWVGAHG